MQAENMTITNFFETWIVGKREARQWKGNRKGINNATDWYLKFRLTPDSREGEGRENGKGKINKDW